MNMHEPAIEDPDDDDLVWIYVDKHHDAGHPDYLKVFATREASRRWFEEHDPEGVAFGYPVIE